MSRNRPLKRLSEPEIWKRYKETDLFVSDQGRVKRVYRNGVETEVGWYDGRKTNPQMTVKVGKKDVYIKTIVYETFKGKPPEGYSIVHKNGLKRDNSIYNLEAISKQEHGRRTGPTSHSQKVADLDRGVVYRSAREAGRKLFCSYQMVNDICNGKTKKPEFNLFWWNEEEEKAYRGKWIKQESW